MMKNSENLPKTLEFKGISYVFYNYDDYCSYLEVAHKETKWKPGKEMVFPRLTKEELLDLFI